MANDSFVPPLANGVLGVTGVDTASSVHYLRVDSSGRLILGASTAGGGVAQSTASALTQIAPTTSSSVVLAANLARKAGSLLNNTSVSSYIAMTTVAASTAAFSVTVASGAYFEFPQPVYQGGVNVISTAAAGSTFLMVTEYS